jgi:hypothetical protein
MKRLTEWYKGLHAGAMSEMLSDPTVMRAALTFENFCDSLISLPQCAHEQALIQMTEEEGRMRMNESG